MKTHITNDWLDDILAQASTIRYEPDVKLWRNYVGKFRNINSAKVLKQELEAEINERYIDKQQLLGLLEEEAVYGNGRTNRSVRNQLRQEIKSALGIGE